MTNTINVPKYATITTRCNNYKIQFDNLSFLQRKTLHLLDIEISNKNPFVICSVECGYNKFMFKFDNGVFNVEHETSNVDELFNKIHSFRNALKNLECDLNETNFLQNEILEQEIEDRQKANGYFVRYKLRLQKRGWNDIFNKK